MRTLHTTCSIDFRESHLLSQASRLWVCCSSLFLASTYTNSIASKHHILNSAIRSSSRKHGRSAFPATEHMERATNDGNILLASNRVSLGNKTMRLRPRWMRAVTCDLVLAIMLLS